MQELHRRRERMEEVMSDELELSARGQKVMARASWILGLLALVAGIVAATDAVPQVAAKWCGLINVILLAAVGYMQRKLPQPKPKPEVKS